MNPHYDQSVYRIAFKILDDFCEQYGLSPYIFNIIAKIGCNLIARLCHSSAPVFETYYILLYEICQNVLPTLLEKAVDEIGKNNGFSYFDAERKYNMAFNELGRQFESLEKFYTKLSEHLWDSPTSTWYKDWYKESYKQRYEKRYKEMHKEKWKKKLDEKINNKLDWKDCLRLHFKDIVIYNCKKGQNPTQWNDMKAILEFCKKEDKKTEMSCLIEAYLTANMENFIKAEIPDDTLEKIKDSLKKIGDVLDKSVASGEKNLQNLYDSADRLLYEMEPTIFTNLNLPEDNFKPIDSALSEILINHIYLQDEKRAEDLISNTSGFYCNWLLAYIAVAKGEFEIAKKFYKAAFDNIHFAGICAAPFLKQALALSVYCDLNPDSVRKVIDPEKNSENPLPQDGKRFWEYGYAIGVFDEPANETFPKLVYWRENFSAEFPQEMFFHDIEVSPNRTKPAPAGNFVFCAGNIKEKIEEYYSSLSALKEGGINKRQKIFDGDAQRRPPLSAAIYLLTISSIEKFTDLEEKFLDLIERWLGLSDPETAIKELDLNVIADLGETPLNMATIAYKDFCAKNSDPESPLKKRLKKIVTHILGKTDKNHLEKVTERRRIHPLQNVIDSCDIELVKEFVEKFLEVKLDIDSIRLTPDEISPVYYTIGRIVKLQDPKANYGHHNTNWKYLDVPGITAEDRKRNFFDKMNNLTPEMQALLNEYVIREDLGDESTYGEQIEKLKEICLYLIEQTKDQDAYKFSNNLGTEWTSLTFAAETDDVDICRALLEHGADPNISLKAGGGDKIPNTFLHRCIRHEAWYVLEMFLTDFKDKAEKTIKEYSNSEYEPLAFFKAKNKEKREGFIDKFTKLFESCGANFTINPTDE
ncbi:ankyrin repeat domain-containing protein [bacterium]|nr:ankyrin repeat domain-containing protein [bacterium]